MIEHVFYCGVVSQLTFYSVEANEPRPSDLAGVLCGPGRATGFGSGSAVRLSVTARDRWRVIALCRECASRQVRAQGIYADTAAPQLQTAYQANLAGLAREWLCDARKIAPRRFAPDGAVLRMWALASGESSRRGFEFGLDPDEPDMHRPLWNAAVRAGLDCDLAVAVGRGPVLRVSGQRKLRRLAELMGPPPPGGEEAWPLG